MGARAYVRPFFLFYAVNASIKSWKSKSSFDKNTQKTTVYIVKSIVFVTVMRLSIGQLP